MEVSEEDATGPGLRRLRFHQRGTAKPEENKPTRGGNVGLRELRTTAEAREGSSPILPQPPPASPTPPSLLQPPPGLSAPGGTNSFQP